MKRAWIATALLACSWIFGLDYLQPASWGIGLLLVLAAPALLGQILVDWPDRRRTTVTLILSLPALWFVPLPHKIIPILFAAGVVLHLSPAPRRWPTRWGQGAVVAAALLAAQAVAISFYTGFTARRHELPESLAGFIAGSLRLVGLDAVVDQGTFAIRTLRATQRFAATWELVFDPASVGFLAGGLALLLIAWLGASGAFSLRRSAITFAGLMLAWAPLRTALLLSVVLQRTLRADPTSLANVGSVLVSAWFVCLLLLGPVLLAMRFLPLAGESHPSPDDSRPNLRRLILGPLCISLAVAIVVANLVWVPVGQRRGGRIKIVERHSTWEPTTEPYATTVYGEAGSYNYAAAFAYCEQYFEMSRLLETEAIDTKSLDGCDVLVIKTPTARYSADEVAAVVQFVEDGGSLLLVGDHTNVFNMNTYLNDLSRNFGFTFRNDLLFRVGAPYKQPYQPPWLAHPVVQHVPAMHFAVSCSIDPAFHTGRMPIRNTGLWSLPPAYQESNYHPQAEYRPRLQYGAWCQMWATTYGKGRVLAFADSTLFSNFCVFQPGKTQLLRGMLDWLNHTSVFDGRAARRTRSTLAVISGLLLVVAGLWQSRGLSWLTLFAAGLAGWTIAAGCVAAVHHHTLPIPEARQTLPHVAIDRTICEVPLFTGAFTDGEEGAGYGMLEQWIPRVGNFISRRRGASVFDSDAVVILCPTRSVSDEYRQRVLDFVAQGGHLVIVDAIDLDGSTANSVLWPFGLESNHQTSQAPEGTLRCSFPAPPVPLAVSCEILGGEPVAWIGDMPVAACVEHGMGRVTAVGFGTLFNDANMGYHWLPEPAEDVRQRYEVLYALLREALGIGAE